MIPIPLIRLSAALLFCSTASAAVPKQGSFMFDGEMRTGQYYVPDDLPPTPVPLVFHLHGGGGDSDTAMDFTTEFRWNELADRDKFIVVYPEGIDDHWNDCRGDLPDLPDSDDVGFIAAAIDLVATYFNIDQERVYAAGMSNGSMMSLRLATELSDRIAAVACAAGYAAAVNDCGEPENPISIMLAAGTDDPIVPYEGGELAFNRGTVLSAHDTVRLWAGFLQVDPTPSIEPFADAVPGDRCTVTRYLFSGGLEGTEIAYDDADGGGHAWPGPTQFSWLWRLLNGWKNQDIVYVDEAWEFFQRHALSN